MAIESFRFVAGRICTSGTTSFSPAPGTFKGCLDAIGLTNEVANLLVENIAISPEATAYVEIFKNFLWKACAPTLAVIVGCIAIPKILNKVFSGLF